MKNNTFYQEYYSELYNPEQKIQFIEEEYHGNENTKKSIIYNFKKATREEKRLDKDLCLFSIQDIDNIGFDYKTENMIQQALSYFSSYTEWCIRNGLSDNETGVNDFAIYMANKDLSELIPKIKTKNRYLTREEVIDLTNSLGNPIDQAFVLCLYEGIAGEKLHELRNLRIEDIDFNTNTVTLTDIDGNIRKKKISDKLKQTLINASYQDEYIRGNGKGVGRSSPIRLADTPYIIRTLDRETTIDGEIVNYGTMSQKMVRIKEYTGYKFISIGSVRDSGMINRIVELTKQHGLQKPNDVIFNILRQPDEYNISANTLYRLKQKYELATDLKDFD